jgi:membrane protein YdbS with pleckstrin-like domain
MDALAVLLVVALFLFCPVAAGLIAHQKGRSAALWAFFGLFLGIIGVVFALIARPRHAQA